MGRVQEKKKTRKKEEIRMGGFQEKKWKERERPRIKQRRGIAQPGLGGG